MTVLIIEESLLIGGRIRSMLLESGNTTAVYKSVEHKEAALLFEEIEPEIVLLDMCLPGTMSIELLQTIKNTSAKITIVVLVNCEDYQKQLKCKSIGVDYIIDKYHEFEKIPVIIDYIVSNRSTKSCNEKSKSYSKFA